MGSVPFRAKKKLERILIVEDDGIIARDIQMMLEELGYEVPGIAASGAEALQLASHENVDLLLMDVNIQGNIDGIETAAQLCRLYRLPVVFLTAHTDDNTLKRAREIEPFGYLAKPITMADLKVAVAVALTRYRSQRQVEKREEWLHSILQSTTEAMVITDPAGHIAFFNRAAEQITGIETNAACGQRLDDVLQLLDDKGNRQQFQPSFEMENSTVPQILTGSLVRANQTRCQVLASITRLQQEAPSGSVVVLHDISQAWARDQELRDANARLTRSNEKLTFLSQSLSHDLREPLRAISWYSDRLSFPGNEGLSEESKQRLEQIGKASQHMGTVISSLEEYFTAIRLDRAEAKPIDAAVPFHDALLNLGAAIEASNAQIEAPNLPVVCAHPTALMLIFQNLLANSIKYAGHHTPHIRISAQRDGDFWRFTVADNGTGFDPQQAERIFELFRRAHGREHSGSGIGLATCQRLVEQHSGRIWAETKPGEGSSFHFTLPSKQLR